MNNPRIRIIVAVILGIILVGGSFVVNSNKGKVAATESTDKSSLITRKHIPVTDSDKDGVPDWQTNLLDLEPIYIDATNTEPYVAPDTVTGNFSVKLFKDITMLNDFGLLADTQEELLEASIRELESQTQAQLYTKSDLKNIISTTDKGALRAYGNLVAGNIFHYQTDNENEFEILLKMLQDDNPKHLEELAIIEKQYSNIINALLVLEVPEQYVAEHLEIVNSLSNLRENVYGMQQYFEDPFYMIMRYRRMGEDVLSLNTAVTNLYNTLHIQQSIQFADNETLPVLAELLK